MYFIHLISIVYIFCMMLVDARRVGSQHNLAVKNEYEVAY